MWTARAHLPSASPVARDKSWHKEVLLVGIPLVRLANVGWRTKHRHRAGEDVSRAIPTVSIGYSVRSS